AAFGPKGLGAPVLERLRVRPELSTRSVAATCDVECSGIRPVEVAKRRRPASSRRTKSSGWRRPWSRRTKSAGATGTRRTSFLCAGFIDRQRSSLEGLIIKEANGLLSFRIVVVLNEGEATFSAGFSIQRNENV